MPESIPTLDKWARFAREYVVDFNARAACIRAGYAASNSEVQAHTLLRNPKVQVMIKEQIERAFRAQDLKVEAVLNEICKIAFMDPAEIFNEDGSMKPIQSIPRHVRIAITSMTPTRYGTSVKMESKMKALEMLGKYFKLWTDGLMVQANAANDGKATIIFDFSGNTPGHTVAAAEEAPALPAP